MVWDEHGTFTGGEGGRLSGGQTSDSDSCLERLSICCSD